MNWESTYNKIISYYRTNPYVGVDKHDHHIIMRSMGGSDDFENIVSVPARVHYVLHLILYRLFSCTQTYYSICMFKKFNKHRRMSSKRYTFLFQKLKSKMSRPVAKYDKTTGELIRTYPSIADASRDGCGSVANIQAACAGKIPTYYGFIWKYADGNKVPQNIEPFKKKPRHDCKVLVFRQGVKLGEFFSSGDVERTLNIDHRIVGQCCRGLIQEYNGYVFTYGDNRKTNVRSYKIAQYSLMGDFIKLYDTYSDIKHELNVNPCHISRSCISKTRSAYGFQWRHVPTGEKCKPRIEPFKVFGKRPITEYIYPVIEYNEIGTFIKVWDSIVDACKFYGFDVSSYRSDIKQRGQRECAKNHHIFVRKRSDDFPKQIYPERCVTAFDRDGNVIKRYPSVFIASKETGMNLQTIYDQINGSKTKFPIIFKRGVFL